MVPRGVARDNRARSESVEASPSNRNDGRDVGGSFEHVVERGDVRVAVSRPHHCPDSPTFLQVMASCKRIDPRYRTHSGKCNNGLHPTWGAALEAYVRFLPPEYVDGVSLPRINLPSARDVSLNVHSGGSDLKHPYLMALTALFGQFLVHDLAHTPKIELPDGAKLKCCDVDYEHFHPECFPIRADNAVGCMEYSRSAPHPGNSLQVN